PRTDWTLDGGRGASGAASESGQGRGHRRPRPGRVRRARPGRGVVRRPDPQPIAPLEPEGDQAGRERVHSRLELGVRPADAVMPDDERVVVGGLADDPVEGGSDRLAFGRRRLRSSRRGAGRPTRRASSCVRAWPPVPSPAGSIATLSGRRAYHATVEALGPEATPECP